MWNLSFDEGHSRNHKDLYKLQLLKKIEWVHTNINWYYTNINWVHTVRFENFESGVTSEDIKPTPKVGVYKVGSIRLFIDPCKQE